MQTTATRLGNGPRIAIFAALLMASVLLLRPAGKAEAKPNPEFFGVVNAAAIQPGDFTKMAAQGVRTYRLGFFWPHIEPAPGDYHWALYDDLFKEATAAGIRIFPTLYGTPGWVNFLAGRNQCGSICAPVGTGARNAFATFARAAVERYGAAGDYWTGSGGGCDAPPLCPYEPAACGCSSPLPVKAWQVWNEQNSPKYYAPEPDPVAYASIVRTVGDAIKSVDPSADVVLGGMWGPPDTDAVIPTVEFLKRFYQAANVEASFDSIAVHPYAPTFAGVKAQMTRVRKAVRKAGDPLVGTWVTELGWASGGPRDEGLVKTPKGQARLLTESFRYLIARRRAWKLRGVTWYSWRDPAPGESDCRWCPQAGLLTNAGVTKPAGRAYKRLALGL